MIQEMFKTKAYQKIQAFYSGMVAKRTQVPLINHIDEGLFIMMHSGFAQVARDAYCIHPMIQSDEDIEDNWKNAINGISSDVILLATEYRHIANGFLSTHIGLAKYLERSSQNFLPYKKSEMLASIKLSPIRYVNEMLFADKIQNRKDFDLYHKGEIKNSDILEEYFSLWFEKLDIYDSMYENLKILLKINMREREQDLKESIKC